MIKSLFSLTALLLISSVAGLNILLTNDDGWGVANIRATYAGLKKAGHDVLLVAPADNQSGKGGTIVLPSKNITAAGAEFGLIPEGALYYGHDANDTNIWYFNATPGGCALWAFDVINPQYWGNKTFDLVVSGPNEGANVGEFIFSLSGTIGATYVSVERGIPAVAFSAGNNTHRAYSTLTNSTSDPANLAAKVVVNFVDGLANGVDTKKDRLLPLAVGVNVNIPTFGPATANCTSPPFVLTRFTGGAIVDKLTVNATTGLPQYTNLVASGVNTPLNGDTQLPGETTVSAGCSASVTVYSTDYDAPSSVAKPVQCRLEPLFGKSQL